MSKRTIIMVLVVLVILSLAATLYFKRGSGGNLESFEVLGEVTAQETAKLIGGSGQLVIVVSDLGGDQNQVQEAQVNGFLKGLKAKKGITVAATERIDLLPPQSGNKPGKLRFFEPNSLKSQNSEPGQLGQIANNYAQAKAVVAFTVLPPLNGADITALKRRGAKLVVVSEYRETYKTLFSEQVLHLAIVPRWEPLPETGKKPQTSRDWFDRSYTVITPEKAEGLP